MLPRVLSRGVPLLLALTIGVIVPGAQLTAQVVVASTTYDSGLSQTVTAPSTISTSGTVLVSSGASVTFSAGTTSVRLESGFHAQSGSAFHALILDNASATTPPSVPSGLMANNITSSGFTVNWSPASDGVFVSVYEVQLDGASQGTFTGLSAGFNGLPALTGHTVKVRASNAAGLWSTWSAALNVTTLRAPQIDGSNSTILLNIHIP